MSSHINPEMQPTRDLSSYKFYSQKVLPLVYDESISYYEVLCKVVTYLNTVIDNVNADIDNIETIQQAFLTLQQYVNDFFSDVEQLQDYTDRAETAALAAQGYSASAASHSASAATYASNSANSSVSSASSATSAANSAATSAEMASSAATSASNAATSSSTAITKASQASTSASNALSSANTAAQKAVEASNSATSAEEDSLIAEGYAVGKQNGVNVDTNSEYYHNNAKYYASQAESAGNNAPAIVSSASGDIATFHDGADDRNVESLVCTIELEQDLHGQDAPYPAGGGKNLVNIPTLTGMGGIYPKTALDKAIPAGTYTVSMTSSASSAWQLTLRDSGDNTVGAFASPMNTSGRQSVTVTTTGEATTVSVYANADTTISDILLCNSTATDPTVYAPYSNVCPITGHTECNVYRTGKNLINISDITMPAAGNYLRRYSLENPILAGTYTFAVTTSAQSAWNINFGDANANIVGSASSTSNNAGRQSVTVTLTDTATMVTGYLNAPATMSDFQLEIGSTATDYEAYTGASVAVDWTTEAGTVYGGTIDVVSGKLTVNRAYVDVKDLTFAYLSDDGKTVRFYLPVGKDAVSYDSSVTGLICNRYKSSNYSETNDDRIFFNNSTTASIRSSTSLGSSISDVKTNFFVNNPTYFSYILATPDEYQLTAHQIQTLLATNNIFCDTGSIQLVNYTADTKMYIDNAIATAIASI